METTVSEEAEIGNQIGSCTTQDGDRTYLINTGGTAWSIDTSAATEHLYSPAAPPLLWPMRDQFGLADHTLGPHEGALINAAPGSLEWSIDVPMTMSAATVGAMTDKYQGADFTLDVLKRWKASATEKGSPNAVLATCANSAYGIAKERWSSNGDVQSVVEDITAGLSTAQNAVGCFGSVVEYDEVTRRNAGLEPRLSPLLRARTFEVTGKRLSYAEEAAKLLGGFLKAAH